MVMGTRSKWTADIYMAWGWPRRHHRWTYLAKALAFIGDLPTIGGPMSNNPRIGLYREAMSLEDQRARLQTELERITSRLNAVQSQLFDVESSAAVGSSSAASAASTGGRRSRGRSRRGELKAKVLQALVAAGSSGLRVKDLAATLGTKPANIYAWFQTAPKRIPQIKKIGEAHYRLEGSPAQKHLAGPAAPKAAKGPKAAPAKRGKRSTRPLSKRGELASRILGALKSAGKEGLKVRQLADKLGVKYKNLFIWFATTGKKNKAIKKVGEAHYRLDA
jgi:hypothetical protein